VEPSFDDLLGEAYLMSSLGLAEAGTSIHSDLLKLRRHLLQHSTYLVLEYRLGTGIRSWR
jgi:hypothetical protein